MILNYDRKNYAIVAGSVIAAYYISTKLIGFYQKCQITKKINEYNRQRLATIDQLRTDVVHPENEVLQKCENIIEMSFDSLRSALQNDELSPVEVLQTFQWKALYAQQATNCICEFVSDATAWASELERKFKSSSNKPPLYGIPVSIKECIYVKGQHSTMGMAQFIAKPVEEDSEMVQIMKSLGAVPFVTTNIPQTLFSIGSSNPVYGITWNPYNKQLSSGGSSSGEGALIGCRGSFLGIGNDIGGSVRVPAHCCGICSLKPTVGRLPMGIGRFPESGINVVLPTNGPMGIDVDSLIWFCRSVWSPTTKVIEPYVVPLPFREDVLSSTSKLTIGYYDYDGFVEPTPACKRAVCVAKETLEALGHKLVRFDPPCVPELMRLFTACVMPDGGYYLGQLLNSDGALDPFQRDISKFYRTPLVIKKILGILLKPFSSQLALKYGACAANTSEMLEIFNSVFHYKVKFAELWHSQNLDCVLCPVMASTALTPEIMANVTFAAGITYTALYNALNYPAGVVPCIMTNKSDDESMKSYKANDYYSKLVKKSFESSDKISVPVGVQIVTLPYEDELCLRIMKELEAGLKDREIH